MFRENFFAWVYSRRFLLFVYVLISHATGRDARVNNATPSTSRDLHISRFARCILHDTHLRAFHALLRAASADYPRQRFCHGVINVSFDSFVACTHTQAHAYTRIAVYYFIKAPEIPMNFRFRTTCARVRAYARTTKSISHIPITNIGKESVVICLYLTCDVPLYLPLSRSRSVGEPAYGRAQVSLRKSS